MKYLDAYKKYLEPDPDLSISEWAGQYRYLSTKASSEPGLWKNERTPYLKEIMDCLSPSHPAEKVVFMKGAQVGGTEMGNNWIGYIIHHTPAPSLIVFPTTETAKRHSKMRLDPLIEDCPVLSEKVKPARARDSGNTVLMKEFSGGVLILTGANSAVGLRSMPIRFLFMDEIDGYPDDAAGEGDPVDLAIQRTATFSNRKIFMLSTPTIKNFSRIEQAFLEGDQRYYHVPCPECGELQVLKWKNIKFDKGRPFDAYYVCEYCGSVWHDYQKPDILSKGKWIAKNTETSGKTVSFHLSSLYSPHGWTSWGDIVEEFLQIKDDPPRLQVWVNTKLAETWEDQSGEAIDPTGLMSRREEFGKTLPAGVAVITCGVDVQDNRLEIEIVGWGKDEESWSLDYKVLPGDPSTPELWEQLDEILQWTFQHSKDVSDLRILAACVDSGGHYTDKVLSFCEERAGRLVWAIKGSSGGYGVPIFPAKASFSFKKKQPIYIVGVNDAKETIMQRLRIDRPGAGYCHFPLDRESWWFDQLTGEVVRTKISKGRPVREWHPRKQGQKVEALDCRVYAFAALRGLMRNFKLDLNEAAEYIDKLDFSKDMEYKEKEQKKEEVKKNKLQTQPARKRRRSKGVVL